MITVDKKSLAYLRQLAEADVAAGVGDSVPLAPKALVAILDYIDALQADAEQYRWLRDQHWEKRTLSVIRPADLPLGVQTFSGQLLDDAIAVRRMANPTPLPERS